MAEAKTLPEENVVMVVVQAEREISKAALSWALSHLVRPGDCVTLLAVIPQHAKAQRKRLWNFPKFAGECVIGQGRGSPKSRRREELSFWFSRTVIQLHDKAPDTEKVNLRIKAVAASSPSDDSVIATECRRIGATWIVLDRQLKNEAKSCMQQIPDCSVVLMERNHAKVLRLNLRSQHEHDDERDDDDDDEHNDDGDDYDDDEHADDDDDHGHITHPTPASSPDREHILQAGLRRTSTISAPPPLCAVCRHRAPQFGKPPRFFPFWELEEATSSFCGKNLLGKNETSRVHRGILWNGQVVAVETTTANDGDEGKFHAEVEVFSRAQHRNVVMLLGFSVEAGRRALVYEYICNGSLAEYLHGGQVAPLDWPKRVKIAVGVARGLRYLHEDCRAGFIHGDLRPSNILLTHEFQPLISGFGFSRWKTESSRDRRMRFGYLAPEILQNESLTEKADVYAFGVLLLELLTGRKAMYKELPQGQQFLAEWARPLLTGGAVDQLLDPRVDPDHSRRFSYQVNALVLAATTCLSRDPKTRPTMTKVLRIVEGAESVDLGLNVDHKINGSRRLVGQHHQRSLSHTLPHEVVARALVHGGRSRAHNPLL